jgi:hypothetical protein
MFKRSSKITPFSSLSIIIIQFVNPLLRGSLVIKFIEISRQILFEIDKSLSSPHFRSRYNFLLSYLSQFYIKRLTFYKSPGQ